MIFIDSNVPMYLVGAPHPHKVDAQRLLERAIVEGERLVTSAAALQEILHRYVAIERPDAVQPALDALLSVVDEVYPIRREDVEHAGRILAARRVSSARDALHVAVMEARGVRRILTFDPAFTGVPGVEAVSAVYT